MKVGDLVRYKALDSRSGVIIKILGEQFERTDNILVYWSDGKSWCVEEDWIVVMNSCKSSDRVV